MLEGVYKPREGAYCNPNDDNDETELDMNASDTALLAQAARLMPDVEIELSWWVDSTTGAHYRAAQIRATLATLAPHVRVTRYEQVRTGLMARRTYFGVVGSARMINALNADLANWQRAL